MDDLFEFVSDVLEEMVGSRRRGVRWLGIGCVLLLITCGVVFVIGIIALANGAS
ncbi:MAG: hypothetical protein JNL34_05860 [Anaerolineae bacterium]|nr:hypothetical protein [Anaerolineae bacterium]